MTVDGVVDSVPRDEDCQVLHREVNDEEWDKNDNKILLIVMTHTLW